MSNLLVKTRDGQMVDLSNPNNVRRGMVFRRGEHMLTAAGVSTIGSVFMVTMLNEAGRGAVADTSWPSCLLSDWVKYYPDARAIDTAGPVTFLGCDPTKATDRAECERFGIAPAVDAAAHMFARTLDGFAVDLSKVENRRRGMLFTCVGADAPIASHHVFDDGGYWTPKHPIKFIGMSPYISRPMHPDGDAKFASDDDIHLFCCGATLDSYRCMLPIGEHHEHEDRSAMVKWRDVGRRHLAKCPTPDMCKCGTTFQWSAQPSGTKVRIGGKTRDVGPLTPQETIALYERIVELNKAWKPEMGQAFQWARSQFASTGETDDAAPIVADCDCSTDVSGAIDAYAKSRDVRTGNTSGRFSVGVSTHSGAMFSRFRDVFDTFFRETPLAVYHPGTFKPMSIPELWTLPYDDALMALSMGIVACLGKHDDDVYDNIIRFAHRQSMASCMPSAFNPEDYPAQIFEFMESTVSNPHFCKWAIEQGDSLGKPITWPLLRAILWNMTGVDRGETPDWDAMVTEYDAARGMPHPPTPPEQTTEELLESISSLVPDGCDPKRWRNVVCVLMAHDSEVTDVFDNNHLRIPTFRDPRNRLTLEEHVDDAANVLSAYASIRREGYSAAIAATRIPKSVLDELDPLSTSAVVAWYCEAYEAGR